MTDARRRTIEAYYAACNAASYDQFAACIAQNFVHYYPLGASPPQSGVRAEAEKWMRSVKENGSLWTLDRLLLDGDFAAAEWTHFQTKTGKRHRGTEWYEFDTADRICRIWGHYAAPRQPDVLISELDGFPYADLGYPVEPPIAAAARVIDAPDSGASEKMSGKT
jgi:ketosteroid isomerase-like protein